jgi:CDP-glucose 4,6-dehydratase
VSCHNELNDHYRGKTVLITGHTGFKGGWLAAWLKEMGARVVGYSLKPPSVPSFFEATALEKNVTNVFDDVRNYEQLRSAFEKFRPEFVFHLAAQALVRRSYEEPRMTFETNVMGTVNVLEAAREVGCARAVVVITSDKCYENKEWVYGYREIDELGGFDPYSSSKACAEIVTRAYHRSFFGEGGTTFLASARAGNVIGGGDWGEDRLIPDCIRALSAGKDAVIRSPSAIRPWQHVLDPLRGYLMLGSKMHDGSKDFVGAWNFSPSDTGMITVEDVVKKVLANWGSGKYRIEKPDAAKHESSLLRLDSSKAHSLLGWEALHGIDDAIRASVSWYKKFYDEPNRSMYDFTLEQIKDYEKNCNRVNLEG